MNDNDSWFLSRPAFAYSLFALCPESHLQLLAPPPAPLSTLTWNEKKNRLATNTTNPKKKLNLTMKSKRGRNEETSECANRVEDDERVAELFFFGALLLLPWPQHPLVHLWTWWCLISFGGTFFLPLTFCKESCEFFFGVRVADEPWSTLYYVATCVLLFQWPVRHNHEAFCLSVFSFDRLVHIRPTFSGGPTKTTCNNHQHHQHHPTPHIESLYVEPFGIKPQETI